MAGGLYNIAPDLFKDATNADAVLDRLVNSAYRIELNIIFTA